MKLTKPQIAELREQVRAPQSTYGTHRTRVQNNLVLMRLSEYLDSDGRALVGVCGTLGMAHITEACRITQAGRDALAESARRRATPAKGRPGRETEP